MFTPYIFQDFKAELVSKQFAVRRFVAEGMSNPDGRSAALIHADPYP